MSVKSALLTVQYESETHDCGQKPNALNFEDVRPEYILRKTDG